MDKSRGQNEGENLDWYGDPPSVPLGEDHVPWENWVMFCQGEECDNVSQVYYVEEDKCLCFDCADIVIT